MDEVIKKKYRHIIELRREIEALTLLHQQTVCKLNQSQEDWKRRCEAPEVSLRKKCTENKKRKRMNEPGPSDDE